MFRPACLSICAMALAITATAPSLAQEGCWKQPAVAAARVRTMETMMMVSALRCRDKDTTVLTNYNKFIIANRATLDGINAALKERFKKNGGLPAYDRYVTQIANKFGNGVTGMDCPAMAGLLQRAVAANGNLPALNVLAESAAITPVLSVEGACPIRAGLE
jgi:hypothetical protein